MLLNRNYCDYVLGYGELGQYAFDSRRLGKVSLMDEAIMHLDRMCGTNDITFTKDKMKTVVQRVFSTSSSLNY